MRLTTILVTIAILVVIGGYLTSGLSRMLTADANLTNVRLAEALR